MRILAVLIALFYNNSLIAQLQAEKELGNQLMFCNEPSNALNPANPKRELIATNKAHLFSSANRGKRFSHKTMKSSLGVYGDPVLFYTKTGSIYFVHLSQDKTKEWPESFDQIVIQRSDDQGKNWTDGTGIGKNGKMHDKAWVYVDEWNSSKWRDDVFVSWTQFDKYESKDPHDSSRILFAKSSDKGHTFSIPLVISDRGGDCMDDDETVEGATSCTTPDGDLFVAWAGNGKIFLDKSTDGGISFGKDRVIAICPGGWNLKIDGFLRCNGLPFLNSDEEGKLYLCTAYEEDSYARVFVMESHNKGLNWSKPMAMGSRDSTHYFMPHAYLDRATGNYYILYYKKKGIYTDVMLSYRLKGSPHFTHVRMNTYTFTEPGEQRFMGDYISVCATGNVVSCCWTEPKGLSTVVKTRRLLLK